MNGKAKEIVELKNKNWESLSFKMMKDVSINEKFKEKNYNTDKFDILELEKRKIKGSFAMLVVKKIDEI